MIHFYTFSIGIIIINLGLEKVQREEKIAKRGLKKPGGEFTKIGGREPWYQIRVSNPFKTKSRLLETNKGAFSTT